MADLQNFSIVRNGTANLTVPTWLISGQIVDPATGAILRDFTGANAVSFPQVLGNLTAQQQDDLVNDWVTAILHKRFGL